MKYLQKFNESELEILKKYETKEISKINDDFLSFDEELSEKIMNIYNFKLFFNTKIKYLSSISSMYNTNIRDIIQIYQLDDDYFYAIYKFNKYYLIDQLSELTKFLKILSNYNIIQKI